ncbi:g11405 [Coccomyxa viridis]|uniref:G11405 protein n=1 Tax=Coccomyxa viridis TaxID=1274662 RepID=A0ABP1G7U2_9CHLO
MASVPSHFQKLVQLVARSFYAGECPPKDAEEPTPQKSGRKAQAPIIGLGVIILDSLLRREWVKEDELAADLKVHPRILRKALRWFEQEQLVTREHRKEARKRKKAGEASGAQPGDGPGGSAANGSTEKDVVVENADELPPQALLHSYSCLDFASILDVTQLRLYRLRKLMKDRVQNSQPVLEYTCPKCGATYTTLQASALIDFRDGQFHCEHCQTVLITAEAFDGTQSSQSARRERLKAMKELQVRMEKELAPLLACVEEVKKKVASEKRVPSYGTLKEWAQARADMAVAAARGAKRGNGVLQPAQVEVDLSGQQLLPGAIEEAALRELPPWMRAEASASVSRSADSTGAAQVTAQQGVQQHASSTEQQDLQAAYARQWEEQVRKRQAELASRAGADAAAGQAGDPGKMKGEGGWTAEPQLTGGVKPEPKQEVQLVVKPEDGGMEWQAADNEDDDEEEWEEA